MEPSSKYSSSAPSQNRSSRIAGQIKEKSKARNTLLAEKKKIPALNIVKHRDLSHRIAELTEELEELRSEKKQLLSAAGSQAAP